MKLRIRCNLLYLTNHNRFFERMCPTRHYHVFVVLLLHDSVLSQSCSNEILRNYSGKISDGIGDYGNHWHCAWIIVPNNATSIQLNVTALALQGADSESPRGDSLRIWECEDEFCEVKLLLMQLSSFLSFDVILKSTTGVMQLEFESDDEWSYAGFEASYKTLCPEGSCGPGKPFCSTCRTECPPRKSLVKRQCGPVGATDDDHCKCEPGEFDSETKASCIPCPESCMEGEASIFYFAVGNLP